MNLHAILMPVFVEVALVFVLLFVTGGRRYGVVKAGGVRREDVILGERSWPAAAQQAANAFSNQFELPVLYLALVPLALFTRKADLAFVVMSWIFVASRMVHAAVYVTTNHVPYRFTAYTVGAVTLMLMWLVFALRILAIPLPA